MAQRTAPVTSVFIFAAVRHPAAGRFTGAAATIKYMRLSARFCSRPPAAGTRGIAQRVQAAMLIDSIPLLEGKRIVLASASPRRRELLSQVGLKFEVGWAQGNLCNCSSISTQRESRPRIALLPLSSGTCLTPLPAACRRPPPPPEPVPLQVVVSSFEETLPHDQYSAPDYARHTATHKALDVAQQLRATSASAAAGSGSGGSSSSSLAAPLPPFLVIGADTVVEYGDLILEKPVDAEDAARMLRMLSGQRHHVHTGVALVLPPAGDEAAAAGAGSSAGAVCLLQMSWMSGSLVGFGIRGLAAASTAFKPPRQRQSSCASARHPRQHHACSPAHTVKGLPAALTPSALPCPLQIRVCTASQ